MNTITITAIRRHTNSNLTTSTSKDNFVVLMGRVHDCQYLTKTRTAEGKVETVNIGDNFFGVTATLLLPAEEAAKVLAAAQDYFETTGEISVGIQFEIQKLQAPVRGVHPTTGEETLNLLVRNAQFRDIEEGFDFMLIESLAVTNEAAGIASKNAANRMMAAGLEEVQPAPAKATRKAAAKR